MTSPSPARRVLDVGEVAAELEQDANVRRPDEGDALSSSTL